MKRITITLLALVLAFGLATAEAMSEAGMGLVIAGRREALLADLQQLGCLHLIPLTPEGFAAQDLGPSKSAREALRAVEAGELDGERRFFEGRDVVCEQRWRNGRLG